VTFYDRPRNTTTQHVLTYATSAAVERSQPDVAEL